MGKRIRVKILMNLGVGSEANCKTTIFISTQALVERFDVRIAISPKQGRSELDTVAPQKPGLLVVVNR